MKRWCACYISPQMHTGQLKAAVRAFQRAGQEKLACVQAPLVPHNGGESWIARQFELEYLVHFGLVVPGLAALRLPVMLGGTSNHFRRSILEEVGGWDPFNVTEDADLGLRLSAAGYRIGMIIGCPGRLGQQSSSRFFPNCGLTNLSANRVVCRGLRLCSTPDYDQILDRGQVLSVHWPSRRYCARCVDQALGRPTHEVLANALAQVR